MVYSKVTSPIMIYLQDSVHYHDKVIFKYCISYHDILKGFVYYYRFKDSNGTPFHDTIKDSTRYRDALKFSFSYYDILKDPYPSILKESLNFHDKRTVLISYHDVRNSYIPYPDILKDPIPYHDILQYSIPYLGYSQRFNPSS